MDIVNVTVVDLTKPSIQEGVNSGLIFDTTTEIETMLITDTKDLPADTMLLTFATKFFANGGTSILVSGKEISDAKEIFTTLVELSEDFDFYAVTSIIDMENQAEYIEQIQLFVEGNEKLALLELNGDKDSVISETKDTNSSRLAIYANSSEDQLGYGSGIFGACLPQDAGSITWANTIISGVPTSGYSNLDERSLLDESINYITETKKYIITQFGYTTDGGYIDVIRSKDLLKMELSEALTRVLVINPKIGFTTKDLTLVVNAMNSVGTKNIGTNMLVSYSSYVPNAKDIPDIDKGTRELNGVLFTAKISGSAETINIKLKVVL